MGQGPSSTSKSSSFQRTSSTMNNNNVFTIQSNPNPENSAGSTRTMPLNEEFTDTFPSQNLKSKSYKNYARSSASLSRIFQKKKWNKRKSSISASFNMHDSHIRVELINVNTATEDELMTLSGVNRALAQNIVNHRELIGGFKKIEDLALVSGMGASKLTQIRPEICISRKKPGLSLASSKAPSIESIPSTMDLNRPASNMSRNMKMININQASIFDLMGIDAINQATAARIIEYRDRKGPFQSVDDLRRVGVHRRLLAAIKIHLTTEEVESDKSSTVSSTPTRPPRHIKGKYNGLMSVTSNTIEPIGAECQWEDEMKSVYDLMSNITKRPYPTELFNYYHNNCPAYRVATWNLECLTEDKIGNSGVMEVITRTILENRFSIISVQEVCDKGALEKICKELNEPTLRLNSEWTGYRGNWRFVLDPSPMHLHNANYYLGVLYDSLRVDSVELPTDKAFCPIQNGSLWQYALFQIHCYSVTWVLVNVLSVPIGSGSIMNGNGQATFNQKEITDSVNSLIKETEGAMIMGCFNSLHAQKGLGDLEDLEMILPRPENSEVQPNSLWITSGLKKTLTDDNGIVETGLSHLAIPNGWSLGGKVTKVGPLWCTISTSTISKLFDEDLDHPEKELQDDLPTR